MKEEINIRKSKLRTKSKLIRDIYYNQISNSRSRKHVPPKYTLEELNKWIYKQPAFKVLYDNWLANDCITDLIPSIDRLDDAKGYSFDNIQLMTWKENNLKSYENTKEIYQFNKKGKLVKKYNDINEASEILGLSTKMIFTCAAGGSLSGHGFLWIYKDDLKKKFKERMKKFLSTNTIGKHKDIAMFDLNGNLLKIYSDSIAVIKEHGMGRDTLSRSINYGVVYKKKFLFVLNNVNKESIIKERLNDLKLSNSDIVFSMSSEKEFIFTNIINAISYLKRYLKINISFKEVLDGLKDMDNKTWRLNRRN